MPIFQIELGAKVTDRITGFKGTVTGRCEYITGCIQYIVTPRGKPDKALDCLWVDEGNLLPKARAAQIRGGRKRAGGPQRRPGSTR